MKRLIFLIAVFLAINSISIFACEIKIATDKTAYTIGEYAILTITIKQDHARCLHEGEEPLIKVTGIELVGKTDFTKIATDTWQIKYKVKIIDKVATFTAVRDCTKGGDKETISLLVS